MARTVTLRDAGARFIGADLLERKLSQLSDAVRAEIVREGLAAMADVIREGAARRATDHPDLSAAFATKVTMTQAGRALALVGVPRSKARGGMAFDTLLRWREFGTKPHAIVAGAFRRVRRSRQRGGGTEPRSAKRLLASSTAIFGRRVQHPGIRPRPTLGAAFSEDSDRALRRGGTVIWERLKAVAS
jgi:hypothetical protein